MSRSRMSPSRLAKLSHAQLVELAAEACEGSRELKNKADALIAQVAPLPLWCVDILMSPDLLLQLFSSFGLSEHAAASVCSTWSRAYSRQLRRRRYIDPTRVRRLADVPLYPNGLCMLPGGVLAISSGEDGGEAVKFVAVRSDSDPQALAACRASSLAARRFGAGGQLRGLALTNDGLLACYACLTNSLPPLYKFAKDGSMDELATVPVLADYSKGFRKCAVHQQTQRSYAIGMAEGEDQALVPALVILDPNLQVLDVVEIRSINDRGIIDVAVHGDQVIILTDYAEGTGLKLLDLDGRFLRTIAAGQFSYPWAVAVSHGKAFVIDMDEEDKDDERPSGAEPPIGMVLHVIDIQSGAVQQSAYCEYGVEPSAVLVDGDHVYVSSCGSSQVLALRLAGSEE